MLWVLKLIKEVDIVPGQYFKKLPGTDELWECRVLHGGNTYRVFGFFGKGGLIILTNGIMKKTQKTPLSEIHRAEELKRDYLRRR